MVSETETTAELMSSCSRLNRQSGLLLDRLKVEGNHPPYYVVNKAPTRGTEGNAVEYVKQQGLTPLLSSDNGLGKLASTARHRMRVIPTQKIVKYGPFTLPAITPEYPPFSHLLSHAISRLKELPDFSNDSKIAVMSDFGGEHKGARFNTYSILLMAYNKVGPFDTKVRELREKYGLLDPYSEFVFKDLAFGPRSRALAEFLHLIDDYIHGVVVTIAIDKRIRTVFGTSEKKAHVFIEKQLASMDLGHWKGSTAEKMLRVCHAIAVFAALTTQEKQRLLWYCDDDAINEDGRDRSFEHTRNIFVRVLSMYCQHELDIVGFGKSFAGKSHLDDLLSIPDLAAGVVQDLLQAHDTGSDAVPGCTEKEALIRWLASQGRFLSKITIRISKLRSGELSSGLVQITPVQQTR